MAILTAMWVKANGSNVPVVPANRRYFTLQELQKFVGGHIEIVGLADGRLMVLHDEGKLLDLTFNSIATGLFMEGDRLFYDPIMGDVLVCSPEYLDMDDDADENEDDTTEFNV